MYLDKNYQLKTGVRLKVSTAVLQELIVDAVDTRKFSELERIHSTADLTAYLSIVVSEGAADLIKRREHWIDHQTKTDLIEGKSIPFNSFCNLFWRNLDEVDRDGDEWQQLIASDEFYSQMTILLNKVRVIARSLQHQQEAITHLPLGVCRT